MNLNMFNIVINYMICDLYEIALFLFTVTPRMIETKIYAYTCRYMIVLFMVKVSDISKIYNVHAVSESLLGK